MSTRDLPDAQAQGLQGRIALAIFSNILITIDDYGNANKPLIVALHEMSVAIQNRYRHLKYP